MRLCVCQVVHACVCMCVRARACERYVCMRVGVSGHARV